MRALRERVERDGGDALTVARRRWAAVAGWKGRAGKNIRWPRRFCLQLRRPRWDGDRVDRPGGRHVVEAVPAVDVEAATAEAPAPAAAAVRGTTAPSAMTTASGAKFAGLAMRDGAASRRRRDAAQAFRARHASNLSRLANGDPKLPAWVREQYEARRLADDDSTTHRRPDESSVYNEAALRALRERRARALATK